MKSEYDVIVVGSGMGGLAAASILAQVGGKRVLVVESHFKLGGFLHSFRRQGYVWDPGVHYIGEMQTGSMTRQCMDLVTGGQVDWAPLDEHFERFLFDGHEPFLVASSADQFKADLINRFPSDRPGIQNTFAISSPCRIGLIDGSSQNSFREFRHGRLG